MTLLRDLIEIPEVVHKGDFVLRLTEGVANPEATLDTYVVTDQLADCFDHALSLIRVGGWSLMPRDCADTRRSGNRPVAELVPV